jgi:energy-coupling factor transporter ATP-binding protein EcfA2
VNPFASHRIRPGARTFQFPAGESLDGLVAELARQNWWGQIVGPHGTGKSTLLATLQPALEAAGRQTMLFSLRSDHVVTPQEPVHHRWGPDTQVIVDGYEQLSWWQRFRLRSLCRRRRAGLLITSHAPQSLPTLWTTAPSVDLAWLLVQTLQQQAPRPLITREDVERCFAATEGNLREMFFTLYDLHEQRAAGLSESEFSD